MSDYFETIELKWIPLGITIVGVLGVLFIFFMSLPDIESSLAPYDMSCIDAARQQWCADQGGKIRSIVVDRFGTPAYDREVCAGDFGERLIEDVDISHCKGVK